MAGTYIDLVKLLGEKPFGNVMNIPQQLASPTPSIPPPGVQAPQEVKKGILDRIAEGLGITPNIQPMPEEAAGLGPGGENYIAQQRSSIGNQGLTAILLALAGLAGANWAPLMAGTALGMSALGRASNLQNRLREGGKMYFGRAEEERAKEKFPYELELLKSQAAENRATAAMRTGRQAALDKANKFEAELLDVYRQISDYTSKGLKPPASFIQRYNFARAGYNANLAKAQSFQNALLGALSANIPGMSMPSTPQLPTVEELTGGAVEKSMNAPAPFTPPQGYTERRVGPKTGKIYWCKPGTNDCVTAE